MTDIGLAERMLEVAGLLHRLQSESLIRDVQLREIWFLAQGATAPLHFDALAQMFDPIDGPVDREQHIERMTDAIMRGMRIDNE